MHNKFDKEQNLPHGYESLQNRNIELPPRQAEIHRNLEAIGPEIAAFYFDGVKILENKELETTPYLLAHIAREIEGGLRDVLSEKRIENLEVIIQMPDGERFTHEKGMEGSLDFVVDAPGTVKLTYRKIQGKHKASILQSLGVDENSSIAERWISVAKSFAKFAHRHGAWESPRAKEAFVPLWHEFEDVLVELVGTHFNLLNRVDHILRKKPTKQIIKTLPNLLASEVRYAYFFNELDSPAWLKPLKDAGWFLPERQPLHVPIWHALGYVEKVADQIKQSPFEETFSILADIVNTIVDYTNDNQQSMASDHTDWRVINIICALPIEKIETRHITFIGVSLRSRERATLVDSVIGETCLPRLLNEGTVELILALLQVILDAKVVNGRIIPVMEEHWLANTLKTHGEVIAQVCGVEAIQVALTQIQDLMDQDAYSFDFIQQVGGDTSEDTHQDYAELLVSFASMLFQFANSDSIAEKVETLLQGSDTILRRIAITAVRHHYEDLKRLFWEWQENPLEETLLKPELYQLIQANCLVFGEGEVDQVLHWIESQRDMEDTDVDGTRAKQVAYRKREWLSALLETGNQKVVSASQKYEKINREEIDHPGLLWWTETSWGEVRPVSVEVLSNMSNAQIAEYMIKFKEENSSLSDPTERGLAETFEECVKTDPQRFTKELQPFQDVQGLYQHSILSGLLAAWREKKEFDWAALLKFIHQILSTERFWNEQYETGINYRDWVLSAMADLVAVGTEDDNYAFNTELLSLAEEILLVLVEKVEVENPVIATRNGVHNIDLPATFFNSVKCRVFTAMVNYALRNAQTGSIGEGKRWSLAIKEAFTRKLDREVEPFVGYSFAFGAYLPNLLYLDEVWVNENIDRIFLQDDEYHWYAAFLGYLYYSRKIHTPLYTLLKERGYYQKVLSTGFVGFDDEVLVWDTYQKLIAHIYVGWVEGWEALDDETSLIYQLIDKGKPDILAALIHFFWKRRDRLSQEDKDKVRLAWRAMFEVLSQKGDISEYQEVLSRLSGWLALVDRINAEVLEWVKLSAKCINRLPDSTFFVEALLEHVRKTPTEVGDIYLTMLTCNVYPYHDQEHIQEIAGVLYSTGHSDIANQICNLYGEAGFDFLRSLYDEKRN